MKNDVTKEYLERYLSTGDEDSFHSLIEMGFDAIQVVKSGLHKNLEDVRYCRILNVLKELRFKESGDLIFRLLDEMDGNRWGAAFDAYCYNQPIGMKSKLRQLAERLRSANPDDARVNVIVEALNSC